MKCSRCLKAINGGKAAAERCWRCGNALCWLCKDDVGYCVQCEGSAEVIEKAYGSGGRQR